MLSKSMGIACWIWRTWLLITDIMFLTSRLDLMIVTREQDFQQPGRCGESGERRPVPLQDFLIHIVPYAWLLPLSHVQYDWSQRHLRQLHQNVPFGSRRRVHPPRSLLLRLRSGYAHQPVSTAGRVNPGYGHPLRFRRSHRIAYVNGQLNRL